MPLANELRPTTLDEVIGQKQLLGKGAPLRSLIESENIPSMIFWGPPGVGKTTVARIISTVVRAKFLTISAVTDGKDALRKVIEEADMIAERRQIPIEGDIKKVILFIDEIHRWNKAQQDALLPYVESGRIILIGATTENPSFSIISALLSRARVFVFEPLSEEELKSGIKNIAERIKIKINDDALASLANLANGDMRAALNTLEISINLSKNKTINKKEIINAAEKFLRYDKTGEEHYNIISAVHKSLRSSNATAAVYWLMRMLEAGEDPLYIARRLVRFASEDIGNANPNALLLANVVFDTCHKIGMPECDVALVQLAEYLANSPKNNSAYVAASMAKSDIREFGNLPVPLHLRNAPTKLMKDLDYGKGYQYDHDLENKKSDQQCLPDKIKDRDYFDRS